MNNTVSTVSEIVARPVRTAVQMTPAALITEAIDVFIVDLDERGYTVIFGLLTLVIGYIQVAIENYSGKALLRKVPAPKPPVIDS